MSRDRVYRVLYVDKDPRLLDRAKKFLEESQEFTITISTSAREVLDSGTLSSYDAIVSGYKMPVTDGIAFLKEVRLRFGTIPFILFTGREREEVFLEALDSGSDFYLKKGGDPGSQFVELMHLVKIAVEHRRAADGIIVQNRLYSVLSATNKAIVHIRNKNRFFSEICRILVEAGGFRMVWIGLSDTTKKRIEPVASFGHVDGYFDSINISTEDVPDGRGPTGTAYRTGKYNFSNDILADPLMEPWRKPAIHRGYLASAAFPFALGTRNEGVMTLYAPKTGFFDGQVIDLLEEMSRDISFALMTIDDEERRKAAEEALQESEERYRVLFETMVEGFSIDEIILDEAGKPVDLRYLRVNPAFERLNGLKAEDVIGRTARELFPGAEPVWFERYGEVVRTGVPAHFEEHFGPLGKWYDVRAYRTGHAQFAVIFSDITERRANEDILRLSSEVYKLSAGSDNLPAMLNEYVRLLQRYTGCDAIGIRLLDNEGNIPYQANTGFSGDFLRHESPLSLKNDNCMCINVIKGTTDPFLPFYTNGGSFYINATTKFLATVSEEEKGKTRNMCNRAGYESVSLIPIQKGNMILGLVHLADSREGMVPLRTVRILENVALSMGSPILRMRAEEELKGRLNDLHAAYEEITSTQEELRQNVEELSLREQELVESETNLRKALAEKEILLSEVHHRVKNNLTAFISLLSLDGSYEESEGGRALRKDLQNRARSMALVHETLYRTGKFSKVDMEAYLTPLVGQIAASYTNSARVLTVVDVQGMLLDLSRATAAGLIINELVTNSFKYAFPPGFDCFGVREEDCTIRVSLANEDGTTVLRVTDNGRGLPGELDPLTTKSLGLKLVKFLARYQFRAEIEVRADNGTEFIFRMNNAEAYK